MSAICLLCAAVLLAGEGVVRADVADFTQGLPPYEPRPVPLPRGSGYVTADGAVAIAGYNDMADMLRALDGLFAAVHPGFRFALALQGTRTAPPALAAGTTAFAPMGAAFTARQLRDYRAACGSDPVAIRVAHASVGPRARSGPLVVIVNPANPLGRLTVGEVTRIFSTAGRGDEIGRWGALGLGGAWTERTIHPAGLAADTVLGEFMLARGMPGRRFSAAVRTFGQSEDVVRLVGADPEAIGFARINVTTPAVKILAIAERAGGRYSSASAEDVVAGRYAYDRYLYIYVRAPDADPFVREYLRLVLSREGQEAIARTPQGYLPLNPAEAATERAKLASAGRTGLN